MNAPTEGRRLTAAQQALAADPGHLAMARGIAARQAARCPGQGDDLEGAALLGLVDAAAKFDPAAGVKFATYAAVRVFGAVRDCQRGQLPSGWRRDAGRRAGLPGTKSLPHKSFIMADTPGAADVLGMNDLAVAPGDDDRGEGVEWLLSLLPGELRPVMTLLYTRADTARLKAAGRALGLSESRVSQIHTRAVGELRAALGVAADAPGVDRRTTYHAGVTRTERRRCREGF